MGDKNDDGGGAMTASASGSTMCSCCRFLPCMSAAGRFQVVSEARSRKAATINSASARAIGFCIGSHPSGAWHITHSRCWSDDNHRHFRSALWRSSSPSSTMHQDALHSIALQHDQEHTIFPK